ncbi:hypothetical protein [Paraburkholderia youngii]|uniref:hypothetical protein n=1 Tax=Paraburkholderia youngii TaxID=2782701 RepID=UPI003D21F19E
MATLNVQLPNGWADQPVAGFPHIAALTRPAGGVVSIDLESGAFAAGVCVPDRHSPRLSNYEAGASLAQLVGTATAWLNKVMTHSAAGTRDG